MSPPSVPKVRLFLKMLSYSPAVWFAKWGFMKTIDVTGMLFKYAAEIAHIVDYVTDQ